MINYKQCFEYKGFVPNDQENPCEVVEKVDKTHDNLIDVIFAPNPVTGLPQSDIGIILSKDRNPEIANYIKDNLLSSRSSSSTDDVDEALATVKTPSMSMSDYKKGLLNFINSHKDDKK